MPVDSLEARAYPESPSTSKRDGEEHPLAGGSLGRGFRAGPSLDSRAARRRLPISVGSSRTRKRGGGNLLRGGRFVAHRDFSRARSERRVLGVRDGESRAPRADLEGRRRDRRVRGRPIERPFRVGRSSRDGRRAAGVRRRALDRDADRRPGFGVGVGRRARSNAAQDRRFPSRVFRAERDFLSNPNRRTRALLVFRRNSDRGIPDV